MKPANTRWYRSMPSAPHADDVKTRPVEFATKVKLFGWFWGKDRIMFERDISQCVSMAYLGLRCDLVAGHGGYHEMGRFSWAEPIQIPVPLPPRKS